MTGAGDTGLIADLQIVPRRHGTVTFTLTTCTDYLQGNFPALLPEVKQL